MLSWKNDQVLLWLKNTNQTDDVLEAFRIHNITGLTLPMLNSEELKEMGITNLRQRLQLLSDISTLLIEKNIQFNSINLNNEHPLLSELQATVVSTGLIKNISKGIVEDTSTQLIEKMTKRERERERENSNNSGLISANSSGIEDGSGNRITNTEYRALLSKINKLREEVLPYLKELQDKKPLPAPSPSQSFSQSFTHDTSSNSISNAANNKSNNGNNPPVGMLDETGTTAMPTSPSRSMFIANRRKSSSETLATISSEQSSYPVYNRQPSSSTLGTMVTAATSQPSGIPPPINSTYRSNSGTPITTPTSLTHRSSVHRTHSQSHANTSHQSISSGSTVASSSTPKLSHSRSSQRLASADTTHTSNHHHHPHHQGQPPSSTSTIPPPSSSSDTLKQLRAKTEDPCYKILQAAMRSHKLDKSEWRNYVLIICYGGDKERVLRYDEKPVVVFKELNELGLQPSMMLRQVEETDDTGYGKFDEYETPGGRL